MNLAVVYQVTSKSVPTGSDQNTLEFKWLCEENFDKFVFVLTLLQLCYGKFGIFKCWFIFNMQLYVFQTLFISPTYWGWVLFIIFVFFHYNHLVYVTCKVLQVWMSFTKIILQLQFCIWLLFANFESFLQVT